jgi:carbamoyltransferase
MRILGLGVAHDSHAVILNDGEIESYIKEESLTSTKRDANPMKAALHCLSLGKIDLVAYSSPTADIAELFTTNFWKIFAEKMAEAETIDFAGMHHLCHASLAFYNSGFDEAYSVVVDSQGSIDFREEQDCFVGRETETIFEASYPATFNCIAYNPAHWFGITRLYSIITNLIGENELENGKTMGLSAYGTIDESLPLFFNKWVPRQYHDNFGCTIPFNNYNRIPKPKEAELGENFRYEIKPEIDFTLKEIIKDLPFLKKGQMKEIKEKYHDYANLAKKMQKESEDAVLNFVFDNCDFKSCKNICFSGGYALNCLANFRYTQELPPDVNIFIEPVADDAGIAIGAAKHLWHTKSKDMTKRPLTNIYQASPMWDLIKFEENVIKLNRERK